ncbi:hypothetical protein KJA17_02060, partial [Patescibacteria group bacterium]|nr:hypothetical protein [Patescibacteria group bacterium]
AQSFKGGENPGVTLAKGVVFVGFNIVGGLVFLLYAFLFLFRYVALWILVILSPLAFLCYVFPYTKKWWDMWWNQFLQWCIIGIPAAFSIFLANQMIGLITAKQLVGETPGGALTPFASIMGYIVPLAFLVGGLFMALRTGAAGANIAIAGFKWTMGKGIPWVAKGFGAGFTGAIKGAIEEKGARGKVKGFLGGAFTYAGHEKGRAATFKWLERAHLVRPGFYEEARRKRWKLEEGIKRFKTDPTDRLHKLMKRVTIRPADVAAKAAIFEELSRRRKLKEEERGFLPTAKTYGVDTGETLKAMPHWAPDIEEKIREQVEGRSPKQFRQETQPVALRSVPVVISMDVSKLRDIAVRGTTEQREAIAETYDAQWQRMERVWRGHQQAGRIAEARRVRDLMLEIQGNPNFPTR